MPHGVRAIILAVALLGCATDSEDDEGRTVLSKVALMDIPIVPGQMLSLGSPCFEVEIPEPHNCSISVVEEIETNAMETVLPSCALQPDARPCWKISIDVQNCFSAAQQRLDILRTAPPAYAHHLLAQCVSL